MNSTPAGLRVHIALFGRRNAGKSSLINAITAQNLAVVSDVAGTTTDPVYKTMELLPLGPVMMIDTPGLDDEGVLGQLRIEKTMEVLRKTNFALLVVNAEDGITPFEVEFAKKMKERQTPSVVVINKTDLCQTDRSEIMKISDQLGFPAIAVSASEGTGIDELRKFIGKNAQQDDGQLSLAGDLVRPGDFVVLVTPIDKAAPKGRLILPQQQTIRDIIEHDAIAVVTKEHELKETLSNLGKKPSLVITDSQAFLKVSADVPEDIPLTSFSILLARQKGDLSELTRGIKALEKLKPGDHVLVVEGCTHHRQSDDIGQVKIPRWLRQIAGGDLQFEWASGHSFPEDISRFAVVIHCGGCMLNRQEMQYRHRAASERHVAMTNYGMLIAYMQGILERSLRPFPSAWLTLTEES